MSLMADNFQPNRGPDGGISLKYSVLHTKKLRYVLKVTQNARTIQLLTNINLRHAKIFQKSFRQALRCPFCIRFVTMPV